ncbi:MAG TPA: hypothetical protein VNA04_12015 [Thermoanaerobaculia bacterium]|nr:hypothetical protein [Thermoanaerobaculia bacterium]
MTSQAPHPIHQRALDDLRFIRSAVESAGAFTAVSGLGGIAMGVVGLAAAAVAAPLTEDPHRWLTVWISAATIAATIGLLAMVRKSRRGGSSLVSAPARRFALAFLPALGAAAMLTTALVSRGLFELLPPLWLLLYGVAVSAGGALSVRVVPFMGIALLAIGLAALFVPFQAGNLLLGLGFGVVHVAGGVVILRRYGG